MLEQIHIGIRVSDMERSVDFYKEILGLELLKKVETPNATCAFMRAGKTLLELVKREGPTPPASEQCHLAFATDDIVQEIEVLKGKGLVFSEDSYPFSKDQPKKIGENAYIFFFRGPDGELFELCQNAGNAE